MYLCIYKPNTHSLITIPQKLYKTYELEILNSDSSYVVHVR